MSKSSRDQVGPDLESRDRTAMELFSVVCRNGGSMDLNLAVSCLSLLDKLTVKFFGNAKFVEECASKILNVEESSGRVEAVMPLQFCREAAAGKCSLGINCNKLHLCPYFLKGKCSYGKKCRLSHDIKDTHTSTLLRALKLDDLDDSVWSELLKRVLSDTEIERGAASHNIPEICKHYNNQGGCKKKCSFLHVCRHFVDGECKFGTGCKRDHQLKKDQHNLEVIKQFKLSSLLEQQLLVLLRGREKKRTTSTSSDSSIPDGPVKPRPAQVTSPPRHASADASSRRDVEICGFHLKGSCSYGVKCLNLHRDLPYQWQYCQYTSSGGACNWKDFSEDSNLMMENKFCDLKYTFRPFYINTLAYQISFTDMTANSLDGQTKLQIRRVSTLSSAEAPPGHIFSTHWTWYWRDEQADWQSYDSPGDKVAVNTTCSKSLEKDYLQGKESHPFSAGKHQYILYLQKMYQRNTEFLTEREVIRRPELVTKDRMKDIAERRKEALKEASKAKSSSSILDNTNLPSHWTSMTDKGDFLLEKLSVVSQEYKDAEKQFQQSMSSAKKVIRIERIQNPDLWFAYCHKKARMQSKTPDVPVKERELFHGTNAEIRHAICQQGFDWRMCGKHGTAFGKGSYFACQSNYSHRYTDHSDGLRYMFIAKVLVGSYAEGSSEYTRPPPKVLTNPYGELHDSCVNDRGSPSIFVVFENSQSYPEYLISYQ